MAHYVHKQHKSPTRSTYKESVYNYEWTFLFRIKAVAQKHNFFN